MKDERFEDFECAKVLFELVKNYILETEGSYIPVHVPHGIGFMNSMAVELSKFVTLKEGVMMKELPKNKRKGGIQYSVARLKRVKEKKNAKSKN